MKKNLKLQQYNLKDKFETKLKDYWTTARLCSYWKAAGQLLKSWKYSEFNQRNPKTMNHERRQKQVRTAEATELKNW